jgi:antitoxin CcdA
MRMKNTDKPKRRPVNLSIRADIIADAKAYNINASQEAEKAIEAAVKKAKAAAWADENREHIDNYNNFFRKNGLLMKPYWDNLNPWRK